MLAYGARCSVGDQMHPAGEMDMETYRIIGEAYGYVKSVEPWCFDAVTTTRLGVWLSRSAASDEGVTKMLLERQMDFDIVTEADDLSRFDAIILPDAVLLDDTAAARIDAYVRQGGGVLLTGFSGLNSEKTRFMIDTGAEFLGEAQYENDYLQLREPLSEGLISSPFLFYEGAYRTRVVDADVLASVKEPYFNRTYARYCSHQNAPYRLEPADHPGAIRKGNVVYLAHPVCRLYREYGAQVHRDYFINALRLIYREPVLQVDMPSMARARLVDQAGEDRYVCHLLYASPIQRGRAEVIEDMPPLYDIPVKIRTSRQVKRVYLAPQMEEIAFEQALGAVTLTVPKVQCHQIVVLDYSK